MTYLSSTTIQLIDYQRFNINFLIIQAFWIIFWHIRSRINQPTKQLMGTALLLLISALLCFAIFYKTIDWFEKI